MMKKISSIPIIWIWAIVILLPSVAQADRTLFSVSSPGNGGPNLRVVDSLTGATIASIPITLSGFSVQGATGLARDPTSGNLYALLRVTGAGSCQSGGGGSIPRLVTINSGTGVATDIGSAGDCFSGLAFSSNGTLYGVTGDGANIAETLYSFNKTTAVRTLVKTLGNGSDGEAIGFNRDDGLIYHASGNDTLAVGPQVFESIDPANFATAPVDIPRSGFDYVEALALTYQGANKFLLTDGAGGTSRLLTITTGGVATSLGVMDHDAKGIAFTPKPPADFDRDIKNDVGIYRDGTWSIKRSTDGGTTSVGWGGPTWEPVQADYDGDGKVDIAVRNASSGLWSILRSSDGGNTLFGWSAAANDIPVPADYDGDGKADFAVYNTVSGGWSIIRSSDGGLTYKAWGGPGWIPVPADYDGDGKADIAVYNPSNGLWSILRSSDGGNTLVGLGGAPQDIPLN
jgi:FG-GAP-like repeat/FG-GAP repeat